MNSAFFSLKVFYASCNPKMEKRGKEGRRGKCNLRTSSGTLMKIIRNMGSVPNLFQIEMAPDRATKNVFSFLNSLGMRGLRLCESDPKFRVGTDSLRNITEVVEF